MCKKPHFITFSGKKRSNWEKNQKKAGAGINCGPWPIFPKYHTFDPLLYLGCQCSGHIFFFFCKKQVQITRYLGKKTYGHQLGPMTHFLQTRNLTYFYTRGEVPAHTFAKLPVRPLIMTPKKTDTDINYNPWPIFWQPQIWPTFIFLYHQFLKSSSACSNSWPTKKILRASTRTHDPFSDNPKIWPTFIYRGEVAAHTFAKLPVRALINDPKKLFQKKLFVTIPQWPETFPSSTTFHLTAIGAKCGLQLNDPIDWFKLRLNQPKIRVYT